MRLLLPILTAALLSTAARAEFDWQKPYAKVLPEGDLALEQEPFAPPALSDPRSEWWEWQQPDWWTDRNKTTVGGKRMHLGVDPSHLRDFAREDLVGGLVWSEWGIVMGQPFASLIEDADPAAGTIAFQGFWNGDSEKIITRNRYYLKDRPVFLDEPGEFWFDRKPDGSGTLPLVVFADNRIQRTDHTAVGIELDFLRIAFSSLAESRTSIEELHTWEFDGPFLRDFAGRRPNGRRDAGALER